MYIWPCNDFFNFYDLRNCTNWMFFIVCSLYSFWRICMFTVSFISCWQNIWAVTSSIQPVCHCYWICFWPGHFAAATHASCQYELVSTKKLKLKNHLHFFIKFPVIIKQSVRLGCTNVPGSSVWLSRTFVMLALQQWCKLCSMIMTFCKVMYQFTVVLWSERWILTQNTVIHFLWVCTLQLRKFTGAFQE